jgi:hypothetical protein
LTSASLPMLSTTTDVIVDRSEITYRYEFHFFGGVSQTPTAAEIVVRQITVTAGGLKYCDVAVSLSRCSTGAAPANEKKQKEVTADR